MTPLVERLRDWDAPLLREAADRIEALETRIAALERVAGAASEVAAWITTHGFMEHHGHNAYPDHRGGGGCDECRALNALRTTIAADYISK